MIVLTDRQHQILEMMRDGEEIAADGLRVWCGNKRISARTLHFFIENILVSRDGKGSMYWHINESGKRLLDGHQDIYMLADGKYHECWWTKV